MLRKAADREVVSTVRGLVRSGMMYHYFLAVFRSSRSWMYLLFIELKLYLGLGRLGP